MGSLMNMLINSEWIDDETGTAWWSETAGPKKYVKTLAAAIHNGQCAAVDVPVDAAFIDVLKNRLFNFYSNYHIIEIETTDFTDDFAFGEYIRENYEPQWRYNPLMGTIMGALSGNNCLQDYVFFVHVAEEIPAWVIQGADDFSRHSSMQSGIMVFFTNDVAPFMKSCPKLRCMPVDAYISPYDVQFFSLQRLQDSGLTMAQRYYTALLVSKLVKTDGRRCAAISQEALYENPKLFLRQLGEDDSFFKSFVANETALNSILWETQMQQVLPITEHIRRHLIETYADMIQGMLPLKDEYGHELTKPEDLELRHLQFYVRAYGCKFPKEEDDSMFTLAYNARNRISHLQILEKATLDELFKVAQQIE